LVLGVNESLFIDFNKVNGNGQEHGLGGEVHCVAEVRFHPKLSCHQMGGGWGFRKKKTDEIFIATARCRNVICDFWHAHLLLFSLIRVNVILICNLCYVCFVCSIL
jgi:hypothetical protein